MRKQLKAIQATYAEELQRAQNGQLGKDEGPKTGTWGGGEVIKVATEEAATSENSDLRRLLTGVEGLLSTHFSGSAASSVGGLDSSAGTFQGSSPPQLPVLAQRVTLTLSNPWSANAESRYLRGASRVDGTLSLIQPQYFDKSASWLGSRLVELGAGIAKAEAFWEGNIPDWADLAPSPADQDKRFKWWYKAEAMRWELRVLEAHTKFVGTIPQAGYKGQRCFTIMCPALAVMFREAAEAQGRIGAPVLFIGRHMARLAEAEWVCVYR